MSLLSCSCRGPRGPAALVGLLTLFLHLPVKPAEAQTPAEMIRDFAVTATGFTLRGDVDEGSLRAERQRGFSVEIQEGVGYMVVGFCDSNCTRLDLAILDPSGEEFGSEDLPDATPVLMFTPEVSGRHQIVVDMVSCSVEPCLYAVGILEKETLGRLRWMGRQRGQIPRLPSGDQATR